MKPPLQPFRGRYFFRLKVLCFIPDLDATISFQVLAVL